jgi:hypothetical protein
MFFDPPIHGIREAAFPFVYSAVSKIIGKEKTEISFKKDGTQYNFTVYNQVDRRILRFLIDRWLMETDDEITDKNFCVYVNIYIDNLVCLTEVEFKELTN